MNFLVKPEIIRHDDTKVGGEVWYEATGSLSVPKELTGNKDMHISASGDGAQESWARKHLEDALIENILACLKINISFEGE